MKENKQYEFYDTSDNSKSRIVDEDEARHLLIELYGNSNMLNNIWENGAIASVNGGILRVIVR